MKKPVIDRTYPPSPQAWSAAVEIIETLIGRRGDPINTPALTTLTFSNPPTQAEVTALYQYVNRQRAATVALLARFAP